MTSDEFKAWQKRMGWSSAETARRLGITTDTVSNYRNLGIPERAKTMVSLACAALEYGIRFVGDQVVRS